MCIDRKLRDVIFGKIAKTFYGANRESVGFINGFVDTLSNGKIENFLDRYGFYNIDGIIGSFDILYNRIAAVDEIEVLEDYRRCVNGTELMRQSEDEADLQGVSIILLIADKLIVKKCNIDKVTFSNRIKLPIIHIIGRVVEILIRLITRS